MTQTRKIVAILAGGKATRFDGQDKGEIEWGGKRFIDIICKRLALQSDDIIISGTDDYGRGYQFVPDVDDAPVGPVGGIYSLWQTLASTDIEGFYTVPVDGPNLPLDLTQRLYSPDTSTIAKDEFGRHPTFAWWRMTDLDRLRREVDFSKSFSLNKLADRAGAKEVAWAGSKSFININRKTDLKNL